MAKIRIAWRSGEVIADLKDTPTAQKLVASAALQLGVEMDLDAVRRNIQSQEPEVRSQDSE